MLNTVMPNQLYQTGIPVQAAARLNIILDTKPVRSEHLLTQQQAILRQPTTLIFYVAIMTITLGLAALLLVYQS